RCQRPVPDRGLGVVVGDGLVATAAHTVEGELRGLTVDGAPATVVAIDARTDLAVLGVPTAATPMALADVVAPVSAVLHDLDGAHDVEVVRTGTLVVHDTTDRVRHERQVHTFTPGVPAGTSGAPITTADRALLGIVVLDRADRDAADAVTSAELAALLSVAGSPGPRLGCGRG
ncbi:MAG: hypothetical protein H0W46_01670, partial [Acidimicrobiia bacterium]|nr:hypothetical protein [Acidimicrobiia bacterium]